MANRPIRGRPISLTGGESVYCLNQRQLEEARRLVFADRSGPDTLRLELYRIEETLDRNERAALAFVIIDRLLAGVDAGAERDTSGS